MNSFSEERRKYQPTLPKLLEKLDEVIFTDEKVEGNSAISKLFPKTWNQTKHHLIKGKSKSEKPLRVGVVFSGGPAAGGHNVISGILKALPKKSELFGFLNGPSGIIEGKYKPLLENEVHSYLNMGGFDLLGSGRTKIETKEQLDSALKTCQDLLLDGLVVIGGDDSNTNAAILAEFFLDNGCKTRVVGVPKTIDGDLASKEIPISFGFDTACKTYSEMIGNICKDAVSSKKYTHFIKLMGRSASHITLECALSTKPNMALIGEEEKSLSSIVDSIADLIMKRHKKGKEYGVILIPEGLIEFIPEVRKLISSLNKNVDEKALGEEEKKLFLSFPEKIQKQLLMDRDPHGNVQVSQIDTQVLLIDLVKKRLKEKKFEGKFTPLDHFLGYEGRCAYPTNFDANYCYVLGLIAAIAIREGLTGVICAVPNLKEKAIDWKVMAIPIVSMIGLEIRKGKEKPVIAKTLVDVKGRAFTEFAKERSKWEEEDAYVSPGPIQYFGPGALCDMVPHIL